MAHLSDSAPKLFICTCQKELLFRNQIIDHLKLRATHSIKKAIPQSINESKNLVLKKIAKIAQTQIQVQTSFNQLITTITQNTSTVIQILSNIINLYRHLTLNPPKANDTKNFEVINAFKLNPTLSTALAQHFAQQLVVEAISIDTIAKNFKSQAIDIRRNHVGAIMCMEVFSDEKRVVTGGFDGAVRIWDLQTKSQIWFIIKHKYQVTSLALGNKEDLVLTGSQDTSVRFWNVKQKCQIHKFQGHLDFVTCVLFSEDQSTGFSGSADKTIRSWNLQSFTPKSTITFENDIWGICLIRQEKIIVACCLNGCVSFFNFKDNRHFNAQSHHNFLIRSICFAPNEEQFITGSDDGTVEVWHTNGIKKHFFQKKHSGRITIIKISACSELFATGSEDKTVVVWDFSKLQTIRVIENQSSVFGLYFVKNLSNLLICWGFGINWCSLSTFVNQEKIKIKALNSIGISGDLKYAAYGYICVCLIDIGKKKKVAKSSNIKQNVLCLRFSPNSKLVVAGCGKGEITILSIPNLVHVRTLYTKLLRIQCLSISISNELIGFSDRRNVKIMSIQAKEVLYGTENESDVFSVCFCSDDENFIYSDNERIYVTKKFILLKKISFGVGIRKIFVNEDDGYFFVCHFSRRWSIIKAESLEKVFEYESKKFMKKWCTKKQDILLRTHSSLPFD